MDKLLTQHVILNNISFDVIQTLPFIRFVQGVAAYGSRYKVPSYSTLRTALIPNSRIEVGVYVSNVKKSWVTTGCTLMSNIWSDMKFLINQLSLEFDTFDTYSPTSILEFGINFVRRVE